MYLECSDMHYGFCTPGNWGENFLQCWELLQCLIHIWIEASKMLSIRGFRKSHLGLIKNANLVLQSRHQESVDLFAWFCDKNTYVYQVKWILLYKHALYFLWWEVRALNQPECQLRAVKIKAPWFYGQIFLSNNTTSREYFSAVLAFPAEVCVERYRKDMCYFYCCCQVKHWINVKIFAT